MAKRNRGALKHGVLMNGTLAELAYWLLSAASLIARVCAWLSCAFIVILSLTALTQFGPLNSAVLALVQLQPALWRGLLVLPTPFGGAFRGDMAITAVLLFVLDYVLVRLRDHACGAS